MRDWFAECEKAVDYLRETESEYARYRGLMKAIPAREKIALARLMLESPESSVAAKKIWAEASEEWESIIDESQEIQTEADLLTAKRDRANLTVEIYRSVNSAQKRGNP